MMFDAYSAPTIFFYRTWQFRADFNILGGQRWSGTLEVA